MKYTIEPGRALYCDGLPLVYLHTANPEHRPQGFGPHDADQLAHEIVFLLNSRHARSSRGKETP